MNSINKNDLDPQETQEWVEAMEAVIERDGHERAQYIPVSYTHLTLPTKA